MSTLRKIAVVAALAALGMSSAGPASSTPDTVGHTTSISRTPSGVRINGTTITEQNNGMITIATTTPAGAPAVLQSASKFSSGEMPVLSTLATSNSAQLTWDEISKSTRYQVFRDNKRLYETYDETYIDKTANPGGMYNYVVQALTPRSEIRLSTPPATPALQTEPVQAPQRTQYGTLPTSSQARRPLVISPSR